MPKFGTTCVSYDPHHPVRVKARIYQASYYAKHGQTEKYKARKRQEGIRRRNYRRALKLQNKSSSDATTARSEICCDAEPLLV